MLLYVTDVVPESSLIPAVAAEVLLVLYWVLARILPRSRQLKVLEGD